MRLACPHCGRDLRPEEIETAGDWKECWQLAARLGRNNGLVDEYAEHWRGKGGLSLKKKLRVYREVAQLLDSSEFRWGGRRYRTDQKAVLQAIRETVDAASPPLKNHNYLLAILAKNAEKLSAEGLSAREEQRREDARRILEPDRGETPLPQGKVRDLVRGMFK